MPYAQIDNNNQQRAFYIDKGQGKDIIVFIHGWYQNARDCYGSLIDYFQQSQRIIALDLPGHGSSYKDDGEPVSIDKCYLALNAILRSIHGKNANITIITHGTGAYFGLRAAIKNPDIIRNLVLISPMVDLQKLFKDEKTAFGKHIFIQKMIMIWRALRGKFPFDDRSLVYDELKGHRIPTRWQYYQLKTRNHPHQTAKELFKSYNKARIIDLLPTLAKPVLLCYGEFEAQSILEEVDFLAETLPAAKRSKVIGSGSHPQLQASTQVQKQIEEFIEEHQKKGLNWRRFFNWKK